jgi:hypothetical protein
MSIWTWIHEFEMEAHERGDRERVRLATLHGEAYVHRQKDPDRMLALLEEGRQLALRLHEPWWVLFYEHWKLETLIYYKDDYREVVDLAVRATLELRKPVFETYPLRFGIWCNLVAAYLCVEPRGYASAIRKALAYLQTQVPDEGGDRYLLQARRHWFAYEIGELEEAHALALEELAMADSDPDRATARHHEVDTYKALCWIAFRRRDWAGLAEYASTGEERARSVSRDYRYELALFLLWQALCARRDGHSEHAKRLARQGTAQMARLGQPPGESYYDALAYFHEMSENSEESWQVRQRELETTVGKGQLAYECLVRLKRVKLLKKLGAPLEEEIQAVHDATAKLRAPEWYLEELGRVLRGESNEKDWRV